MTPMTPLATCSRRIALFVLVAIVVTGCGSPAAPTSTDSADSARPADPDSAVVSVGDPERGAELFGQTCAACHGPDARGVPGLGRDMHDNAFIRDNTDDELVAFLKAGRPASHPDNTAGVDMPPKGGNPALSDDDLTNLVAYMRSLQ